MAFDIGRVCVKLAGRDAGKQCVVIDILDNNHVLIDGATRRRKCNTAHLEPTEKTVDITKEASHDDVLKALGITEKKGAKRQATPRPRRIHKGKRPRPTKKQAKLAGKKAAKVENAKEELKTAPAAPQEAPAPTEK